MDSSHRDLYDILLKLFKYNEIQRDMQLMGVTSVDQLSRSNIRFR